MRTRKEKIGIFLIRILNSNSMLERVSIAEQFYETAYKEGQNSVMYEVKKWRK